MIRNLCGIMLHGHHPLIFRNINISNFSLGNRADNVNSDIDRPDHWLATVLLLNQAITTEMISAKPR